MTPLRIYMLSWVRSKGSVLVIMPEQVPVWENITYYMPPQPELTL